MQLRFRLAAWTAPLRAAALYTYYTHGVQLAAGAAGMRLLAACVLRLSVSLVLEARLRARTMARR